MKSTLAKIVLFLVLLLLFNSSFALKAVASEHSRDVSVHLASPFEIQQAAAGQMWISPTITRLSHSQDQVGSKLNVTIWVNSTLETKGWQIILIYQNEFINATRTGYTAGGKSDFYKDVFTTFPVNPVFTIDYNVSHNTLKFGEAAPGPPLNPGYREPGYGSLCWIEFEITSLPANETMEICLDIVWAYISEPPQTYLLYWDGSKRPTEVLNGFIAFTSLVWDVTGDGYVGIDDIVEVADHFGQDPGHPEWNPKYDVTGDNYVGIDDIVEVAGHFGESA
jgi:hypothetical protein